MKATLVPVEQHTSPAALGTALVVARTFDSYIEGVASGPSVPDVIVTDVGMLPSFDPDTQREWVQNARQQFEAWIRPVRPAPS